MTLDHAGEVAIVTGGSVGIGLAIAQRLVAAGASTVITGRNAETGKAAESALRAAGGKARFVPADLTDERQASDMVAAATETFGPPTMLVNNAGPSGEAFGLGPIEQVPADTFRQSWEIGAAAALWCCRAVLPHMIAARRGAIVNISALAATRALPLMGAYAMSKAALEALGRQIANDYARDAIRCNNLIVGTVRPEPGDSSTLPEQFDHGAIDNVIADTTMLGRVGSYAEAADAALFLLGKESRYITGANIPVEGGALARIGYPDYRTAFAEQP